MYRPKSIRFPMNIQLFADGNGSGQSGGQGNGSGQGGGSSHETFSREYVQDLRNESAEYRTKLRAAEKEREEALAKAKTAEEGLSTLLTRAREVLKLDSKTDVSVVTQKLAEAVTASEATSKKAQDALLKAAFVAAGGKANLVNIDDAFKLADLSSVKVDLESMSVYPVDKDGKQITKDGKPVTGLDDLVTALVKDKPYLAGKPGTTNVGGGSNPGHQGPADPVETAKKLAEERNKGTAGVPVGGFDPWAPAPKQ